MTKNEKVRRVCETILKHADSVSQISGGISEVVLATAKPKDRDRVIHLCKSLHDIADSLRSDNILLEMAGR